MNEQDKYNVAIQKMLMDNLPNSETVTCIKCGNSTFVEIMILKRFSPVITQTKKPVLAPFPVVACNSCGTPVEELMPEALKTVAKPSIIAEK